MTLRTLFCFLIFMALSVMPLEAGQTALAPAPYGKAERLGSISNPLINEASGLAPSPRDKGVLWVINDSGNACTLFAVSPHGQTLGEFSVKGASNFDWEDLASFCVQDESFLVIADVGDNLGIREYCTLFIVKEPKVTGALAHVQGEVNVYRRIRFRYEDGPRDCEAMAVDLQNNRVLLLSKRTRPPVFYALSLDPGKADERITAQRIGQMVYIPSPTPEDLKFKYGKYWSQPTAMDLSVDGNALVILTYKHAYFYEKFPDQSWMAAVKQAPRQVILPHPDTKQMVIRESICFGHGTHDLYVTAEQVPAPVFRLKFLKQPE